VADQYSPGTVEVTWGRALKVWWSLAWRTVLFGGLAGALMGGILGAVLGMAGRSPQEIAGVTTWAGIFVGIPVGVWVVRGVLNRSWSDFRIALVPVTRQ
jgi:hypothetical protein